MNGQRSRAKDIRSVAPLTNVWRVVAVFAIVAMLVAATGGRVSANRFGDEVAVDVTEQVLVEEEPAALDRMTVIINLHGCPAGYDPAGLTIYDVAAACNTLAPEPMAFELYTHETGYSATIDWLWTWDDVAAGKTVIRQAIPDGYLPSFAYCKQSDGFYFAPMWGGELIVEVFPGETLYCDWMVTPERSRWVDDVVATDVDDFAVDPNSEQPAGEGSLFVNGIGCPEGFDAYNANMYELAAGCGTDGPETQFTVATAAGTVDQFGSDLSIDAVAGGVITVTYQTPAGYGLPRVFCNDDQLQDLPTYEAQVTDGGWTASWNLFVADGAWVYCDILSIPALHTDEHAEVFDAPAELTIFQFACDVTTLVGPLTRANLEAQCAPARSRFNVTDGSGDTERVNVGSDGVGAIDGLTPGYATVYQRRGPSGFDGPQLVFCRGVIYGDGYIADGAPLQPEVIDGTISLDLPAGMQMGCSWFNLNGNYIPFDGPASLTAEDTTDRSATTDDGDDRESVSIVRRSDG